MNKITIIRGDIHYFKFQRIDNSGEPILVPAENIYFTVKNKSNTSNFIFQKTIEDMEFDASGFYHFSIAPADTDYLKPGIYFYDLEVVDEDKNYKQTISIGNIELVEDITTPENEG